MPRAVIQASDVRHLEIGLQGRYECSKLVQRFLTVPLGVPRDHIEVVWGQPYESASAINATSLVVSITGDVEMSGEDRQAVVEGVVDHLVRKWMQLPVGMDFGVWLLTPYGNAWASRKPMMKPAKNHQGVPHHY